MVQTRFNLLPQHVDGGHRSFAGVVKQWECDRNAHWNMQFYQRSFQLSSELLATCALGHNPGAASASWRHCRFLGELFSADGMHVSSARIADGPYTDHVVHMLYGGDDNSLRATSVEKPNYPVDGMISRSAESVAKALPRGIAHGLAPAPTNAVEVAFWPLGVVRPSEVDHEGLLLENELFSRLSGINNQLVSGIGLDATFINEKNINRMGVESKTTRYCDVRIGEPIEAYAHISAVGAKTFSINSYMRNSLTKEICAQLNTLMLVVDLESRRSIELPEVIRANAQSNLDMAAL